jgi:hypothetical protein|nr:MAG TPA: hypothetical protein [Caudoviricetes sp.]
MAEISNAKLFDEGMRKARKLITQQIVECLTRSAYALLVDAETAKEYHNLTGNTLTSYAVGIYANGTLKRIVSMYDADNVAKPTSVKLSRGDGKGVVIVEDYDSGRFIPVKRGYLTDTDGGYGLATSKSFLSSYKPSNRGFSMVMCTGTEYSEFLEKNKGLNVLTETFMIAPRTVVTNLKPIR